MVFASVPHPPFGRLLVMAHRQGMHACPIRKVVPEPLFFTEPYLQSSIPIFIHLTQRGVLGIHFFRRPRGGTGNCIRVTVDEIRYSNTR